MAAPRNGGHSAVSDEGYTLLEMLIALIIAGLATAAIGTAISRSMRSPTVAETRAKLDWLITAAKAGALRQKRTISVELIDGSRILASPRLGLSYAIPQGVEVTFTGTNLTGSRSSALAAIYFLADGSATGATIELRSGNRSTVRRIGWINGRLSDGMSDDE